MVSPRENVSCRFCWGLDREDGLGRLIAPCLCSGSIKWVHTSCLNSWFLAQPRGLGRTTSAYCEMCRTRYQIPVDARSAFDDEIWEEFAGGPRSLWRRLVRLVEGTLGRRSAVDWLVQAPVEAIMLGGFVRGMRTAGPFSRALAKVAFMGAQAGGAAFAQKLPHMLLLTAVVPHRLRVSLVFSAGTYLAVLGLQVPFFALIGANIGWCFGYAVGCTETVQKLRTLPMHAARPLWGCLQAILRFGHRRLLPGPARGHQPR